MSSLKLNGSTSGYVEIVPPAVAGNNSVTLPNGAGTLVTQDGSGNITITGVTTVSAGSTSSPSITPTGDSNTGIFFPSADTIAFAEGGAEAARFDSSGSLLVGTTTTSAQGEKLQSNGNLGLTGTGSNQINFHGTAIEFVNRNGTARAMKFYVGASGGAPVAELSTAGTWTNASDVKNKENIEDIVYGIETIKALVPRQYDVKSNGKHAIGFIAQEVQPIIPEVVHESFIEATQESHLGLDYGSMVAVLTKALQESIAKIETLEAKVAALEAS